jgi:penicillin-binding protein 2A
MDDFQKNGDGNPVSRQEIYGSRKDRFGNGGRRFFTKKWFVLVVLTTVLLVVGGCSAVMLSAKSMPLDRMDEIQFASTIYDAKGKPVAQLGSGQREYISLRQVKSRKLLEDAFIAVEDRRFYQHHGVDYRGVARALFTNLMERKKAEGAGTITMQVARNIILENSAKTYTRKIKEVFVAWNLERNYTKQQILQAYLNYIYFGNDVQGIKMAAKIYFDKDISKDELEPHEVALLAGIPKAPSAYDPYRNPKQAKERRNVVLEVMAQQRLITQEEKKRYQQMDLGVNRSYLKKYIQKDQYQAYKHYVMLEAEKRFGLSETELATGGYQIYTQLVPKAQRAMDKAIKDDSLFQNHEQLDGGATMVNPQTGGIAAIAGGREYLGRGYLLRSLEPKQPGSSIKPVTVYAPAVEEKGYDEYSAIQDPPGFHVGSWQPENFQKRYYGKVPMKEAIAKSLNVATVWLLENEVGLDIAVRYAEQAGIPLEEKDKHSYAAMALGGLTKGVDTVQMAQAYTPFANNGKWTSAHAIDRIQFKEEPVDPLQEVERRENFSPKTAYYMTRMLRYNVQTGTGTSARLPDGRDVAGKTGTTQDSQEAWFVGYTREYVMAAMVYNKEDGKVELSGGEYPAKIFRRVMWQTLRGTPVSRFTNPGVKEPEPPFELKPVELNGEVDEAAKSIRLNWNDYSDRVIYRVERSEDGASWSPLSQTPEGGYEDRDIVFPQPETGDPLDDIFGSGKPKTYYYRVTAIDTVTNGEAQPSNTLKVTIQPPPPEKPPGNEQGDQQGDQPGEPEGPGGGQEGPGGDQRPGLDIMPPPGREEAGGDQTGGEDGQ